MERVKNNIATVKIRVSCAATGSLFPSVIFTKNIRQLSLQNSSITSHNICIDDIQDIHFTFYFRSKKQNFKLNCKQQHKPSWFIKVIWSNKHAGLISCKIISYCTSPLYLFLQDGNFPLHFVFMSIVYACSWVYIKTRNL